MNIEFPGALDRPAIYAVVQKDKLNTMIGACKAEMGATLHVHVTGQCHDRFVSSELDITHSALSAGVSRQHYWYVYKYYVIG